MSFCSACCQTETAKTRYLVFSCVHQLPVLFSSVVVSDIEDLPPAVQEKLFDEVLDRDVQKGDFPCCYGNGGHFRSLGNQTHDVDQDSCQTLPVLCYRHLCCQPSLHTVLTLAAANHRHGYCQCGLITFQVTFCLPPPAFYSTSVSTVCLHRVSNDKEEVEPSNSPCSNSNRGPCLDRNVWFETTHLTLQTMRLCVAVEIHF